MRKKNHLLKDHIVVPVFYFWPFPHEYIDPENIEVHGLAQVQKLKPLYKFNQKLHKTCEVFPVAQKICAKQLSKLGGRLWHFLPVSSTFVRKIKHFFF